MINTTNERFSELLQRYLLQDLSDQELDEFLTAAGHPQFQSMLEDALTKDLENNLNANLAGKEREEKIWAALLGKSEINTIPVKNVSSFKWSRLAAAACILFAVSGAVYFFSHNAVKQQVVIDKKPTPKKNPLLPGSEGAILTLADGSTILLDSAHNGSVAKQGGTNIIKNKGKLSYDNSISASEVLFNTITTPKGRQYSVVLADGTKVWLNAVSSIRFPTAFIGSERKVEISGEAYFEVAHHAGMPFRVAVNGAKVEVLGTHFNINAYADEETVKTTLVEGSIRYSANERSLVIRPTEQVVTGQDNNNIRVERNVDLEATMAWKEGRFTFNNMSIDAIMRQVARWYDVEIEYNGPITKELFTGDVSRQEEVTQLLDILKATKAVSFQVKNSRIIVTSV